MRHAPMMPRTGAAGKRQVHKRRIPKGQRFQGGAAISLPKPVDFL
ncbi:MAG TPA: hypothetical protein PKC09_13020 [Paracoccus sp. (in: a-proteobacteria)]|nr:hypothetical protein [uncultured Paracoccus sp.]HMQ42181.1 hypothetical protein [Paracoccus sp. (in: a-proteobacteria)]HMR37157.1 hypothetical protein [Paracoccus sp. (in: a-proteobacteria)]